MVNRPWMESLIGKKNLVGCEIGVYFGRNSDLILNTLDVQRLYLVDPYKDKVAGITNDTFIKIVQMTAKCNLSRFADKLVWIYESSEEAVKKVDEHLDFVYIDGNHKYGFIKRDIELYFPLVCEGVVGGHDYDEENEGNGVKRAVHEFFDPKGLKVQSSVDPLDSRSHDWWVVL